MKLKVLLTTNIPVPYFVDYANELGKYVDLTVVFELKNPPQKRNDSKFIKLDGKNFKYYILGAKNIGNESGLSFKILKFLKDKSFDRRIICTPTTPTGILSCLYCRFHKIPYIIQSEGGFQGSGKGFKERFKKFLMKKATYYLTGMGGDDDYFLKYGATKDKLFKYNFTSSFSTDIDKKILSSDEKKKLKQSLGLSDKPTIIYVGQLIKRKGIDILLKSFSGLDKDAVLLIIGGKPTDEYNKIISSLGLKNVLFIDFVDKDTLSNYYRASDIFCMTTREDTWGLVVNEAMGHGLPVITTNNCIAGKYLINHGFNGYLVNVEDVDSTNHYLSCLLDDSNLRQKMSQNSLDTIKDCTIENMALTIYKYLDLNR